MKWALKAVPRPWLIRLSYPFKWAAPLLYAGSRYTDPIDGRSYRTFLPYGYGNRQRPAVLAPGTLSLERHRLLWLWLRDHSDFFTAPYRVLHIAPEQCFLPRFKAIKHLEVVTADWESPIADIKLDVQDMPFEPETFGVVLCNHVLEHVPNDAKALSEIYRVLKPGGWAILQVPLDPERATTFEDPSITDKAERERIFGQYDHLRVYGLDYPTRLQQAGFEVEAFKAWEVYPASDFERFRLPAGEVLYIARKN
jgi:SAM-dependent methyltransferase